MHKHTSNVDPLVALECSSADMKLSEKSQRTVHIQCAKFQTFLPYGSRGCNRVQWQKKEEEKDKKEKYTPLFSVSGTSEPTNEDPMEMKCDVKQ